MNPLLNPGPPIPATDLLHHTLRVLEDGFLSDTSPPLPGPQLVAVVPAEHTCEIGLTPLDGEPLAVLQGFRAPAAWWAVGVVAPGRARPLDGRGHPGWPVDVVHLVDRTGDGVAGYHHHRPGAGRPARADMDGKAWSGLLDDHLRRVLGLPTPPPADSTLELWTVLWLDELCEWVAADEPAGVPWSALVARHPVMRLAGEAGATPEVLRWTGAHLVPAAELLADTWTWGALRAGARSGDDVLGTAPPDLAEWLDDGLYARLQLAPYPGVGDLLDLLDGRFGPAIDGQLRSTCRAWGIQT